jgi:hypothetical protein
MVISRIIQTASVILLSAFTLSAEPRPTSPDAPLYRYDEDDLVESYQAIDSMVRVYFTRDGRNAVAATDRDQNNIPDFVERVSDTYQSALNYYVNELHFRKPLVRIQHELSVEQPFDVYLLDFAGIGDGAYRRDSCASDYGPCSGFMVQENDFSGYGYRSVDEAIETVSSHELFHGIQAAYAFIGDVTISEGTAVWATEMFAPHLDDYEWFAAAYFEQTHRPLNDAPSGPAPRFAYAISLFFMYLTEQYGADIIPELFECLEDKKEHNWLIALDDLFERSNTTFQNVFQDFSLALFLTAERAQPDSSIPSAARLPLIDFRHIDGELRNRRLYHASSAWYQISPTVQSVYIEHEHDTAKDFVAFLIREEDDSINYESFDLQQSQVLLKETDEQRKTWLVLLNTSTHSSEIYRYDVCVTENNSTRCDIEIEVDNEMRESKEKIAEKESKTNGCTQSAMHSLIFLVVILYRRECLCRH